MSNTCHNMLSITGQVSEQAKTAIGVMLNGSPIKYEDPEWIQRVDGYTVCFSTRWSPPIKVIQSIQPLFPDLEIEFYFEEPMMNLFGAVLSDGRLRENVVYEHAQCEYHDMGHKIWDSTGKHLLEDHSRPVPIRLRMERKMWCLLDKLRRQFRPDPVHSDDIPF